MGIGLHEISMQEINVLSTIYSLSCGKHTKISSHHEAIPGNRRRSNGNNYGIFEAEQEKVVRSKASD